jgi:chorismate synthase
VDSATEARQKARIDEANAAGDTLGGIFEVVASGCVAGLGHMSLERKLDGRLCRRSCRFTP